MLPLVLREVPFRLRSRLEESDSRSAELESCLASNDAVAAPVPIICKACIGCATVELVSELIKQQKKKKGRVHTWWHMHRRRNGRLGLPVITTLRSGLEDWGLRGMQSLQR